jgi:hypothetical protein
VPDHVADTRGCHTAVGIEHHHGVKSAAIRGEPIGDVAGFAAVVFGPATVGDAAAIDERS